jgi:hypothetical protein
VRWGTRTTASTNAKLAVQAQIEIPERHLTVSWSLAPNDDQTLPASHAVQIVFTPLPGFVHGSVSALGGIIMKSQEGWRGTALMGRSSKVATNSFQVALSATESERLFNLKLLKEETWFDIPIVYGDGGRAIIALEKGSGGERAFSDAFSMWR